MCARCILKEFNRREQGRIKRKTQRDSDRKEAGTERTVREEEGWWREGEGGVEWEDRFMGMD